MSRSPFITRNVASRPATRRSGPAVPSGSCSLHVGDVDVRDRRRCRTRRGSGARGSRRRASGREAASASWSTRISRIERLPIGISGFGSTEVYGSSRVPRPPARITTRVRRAAVGSALGTAEQVGARPRRDRATSCQRRLSRRPSSRDRRLGKTRRAARRRSVSSPVRRLTATSRRRTTGRTVQTRMRRSLANVARLDVEHVDARPSAAGSARRSGRRRSLGIEDLRLLARRRAGRARSCRGGRVRISLVLVAGAGSTKLGSSGRGPTRLISPREDVPELRQLVELRPSEEAADPREPLVVGAGQRGPAGPVVHLPELEQPRARARPADAAAR